MNAEPDVEALRAAAAAAAAGTSASNADVSSIELRAGRLPHALKQVRRVLSDHAEGLSLMVFGRSLVRPFIVEQRGFRGEAVESLELSRVSVRALASYLDSVAQFARWTKPRAESNAPKLTVCDCPTSIAQLFLETPEGWGRMPRVNRICETPLLRDGRLISERGYNSEAAVWLHAPPDIQLRTPLNWDTASACLLRVREWLAEFPFADHDDAVANEEMSLDESVAICAMLTGALRASLPAAPGFLIDKTTFGAGATTLAKLVHVILTGRLPAVMNVQSDEEEELRKQLDSAQLAGRACVLLDNVRDGATLSSTALAQLISEPTRLVRILGQSKDDEVSCSQLVLVTGVNVTVANDLVRRFLRCRLAATQERPQERTFNRPNLVEEAQAQRAQILSDLFTITAAYLASGGRAKATALAGFADWGRMCVEPLVWLKHRDPVPSSQSLESEDPVTATLREVITNWNEAFSANAVTVKELTRGMSNSVTDTPTAQKARERLREIFAEICPARDGSPDAKRVGWWLRRVRGRLSAKLSIQRAEDSEHQKVGTWVLRTLP